MKSSILGLLAASAAVLVAAPVAAQTTTIDFDDLAVGSVVANQYADLGVTFAANAFTGASVGGGASTWATNTDMHVVSSSGNDVGALGAPSLVSGNLLRSFNGWFTENGDASFSIDFAAAITSVSLDFAGVSNYAATRLFAYNGGTLLGVVAGQTAGQFTLRYAAPSITRVAVAPGTFNDWVGVDNLRFTPAVTGAVPEPASWALMIVGLGAAGCGMRRRRAAAVRVAYS